MTKFRFRKFIFSLFLLLNCGLAYSLDCFPGRTFAEIRQLEYENSDVIFLGVPVHFVNSNVARVKVGEVFKGTVDSIVYVHFDDFFYFNPHDEGHRRGIFRLWLIYGNKCDYLDNDYYSVIRVDLCSPSRYMGRGFDARISLPPPPNGDVHNSFLHSTIISASRKSHADLLFFEEIEVLRTIRDVRNLKKAEPDRNQNIFQGVWGIFFAMSFLNLILLAVIVIMLRKNKK